MSRRGSRRRVSLARVVGACRRARRSALAAANAAVAFATASEAGRASSKSLNNRCRKCDNARPLERMSGAQLDGSGRRMALGTGLNRAQETSRGAAARSEATARSRGAKQSDTTARHDGAMRRHRATRLRDAGQGCWGEAWFRSRSCATRDWAYPRETDTSLRGLSSLRVRALAFGIAEISFVERADEADGVGLAGGFVFAVAADAGEAKRHTAGVVGAVL